MSRINSKIKRSARSFTRLCAAPALAIMLTACAGQALNVDPVQGFNSERYLGTWYEVARLDHSFERGLSNVSATYTRREDGRITVLNSGYNAKKDKTTSARGKAKFAIDETVGYLKVSFFGPFYGDYIIFDLDKDNYTYASVSGGKDNYLWLLSRTPTVPSDVRDRFLEKSRALGYQTEDLIWVDQSRSLGN